MRRPLRHAKRARIIVCTLVFACVVNATVGCNPEAVGGHRLRTTIDTLGDTVLVTNHEGALWGAGSPVEIDSVDILRQSDALVRPGHMAPWGDRGLLIADGPTIHVIGRDGTSKGAFGRRGDGPGEFQEIGGLFAWDADSILVWDSRQKRLTWLGRDGAYMHSIFLPPPLPWVTSFSSQLLPFENGVLLTYYPPLRPEVPLELAVIWQSFEGDSSHVVARVAQESLIEVGRQVVPKTVFSSQALFAVSTDGRVAYTKGVEYCIAVRDLMNQAYSKICRDYERAAVTRALRAPDYTRLRSVEGFTERSEGFHRRRLRLQHFPDVKNSIDKMIFDTDGRLWIRTVDASAIYDPLLMFWYAELRPAKFSWDVIDRGGRRVGEVHLDGRFEPLLIDWPDIYGVYELPSGERVIGHVHLPPNLGTNE